MAEQDYDAKAREIVGMFVNLYEHNNILSVSENEATKKFFTKQCAIIYCKGMIKEYKFPISKCKSWSDWDSERMMYWQQIITAINKM